MSCGDAAMIKVAAAEMAMFFMVPVQNLLQLFLFWHNMYIKAIKGIVASSR